MSQVITPQVPSGSGLSVREGINAVMAALMSTNSGPSEPPNPMAGMAWFDTTAGDIKIRNAANTAWLLLSDMIGALEYDRALSLNDVQKAQAWQNMGAAMSRNTNGYLRLPNGIIVQWGLVTTLDPGGGASIAFPIAFPNARFVCVASYAGAWAAAPYSATVFQSWDVDKNGTTFWCRDQNGGVVPTGNIHWIAIGW